jgi:hypothetical protein
VAQQEQEAGLDAGPGTRHLSARSGCLCAGPLPRALWFVSRMLNQGALLSAAFH